MEDFPLDDPGDQSEPGTVQLSPTSQVSGPRFSQGAAQIGHDFIEEDAMVPDQEEGDSSSQASTHSFPMGTNMLPMVEHPQQHHHHQQPQGVPVASDEDGFFPDPVDNQDEPGQSGTRRRRTQQRVEAPQETEPPHQRRRKKQRRQPPPGDERRRSPVLPLDYPEAGHAWEDVDDGAEEQAGWDDQQPGLGAGQRQEQPTDIHNRDVGQPERRHTHPRDPPPPPSPPWQGPGGGGDGGGPPGGGRGPAPDDDSQAGLMEDGEPREIPVSLYEELDWPEQEEEEEFPDMDTEWCFACYHVPNSHDNTEFGVFLRLIEELGCRRPVSVIDSISEWYQQTVYTKMGKRWSRRSIRDHLFKHIVLPERVRARENQRIFSMLLHRTLEQATMSRKENSDMVVIDVRGVNLAIKLSRLAKGPSSSGPGASGGGKGGSAKK